MGLFKDATNAFEKLIGLYPDYARYIIFLVKPTVNWKG